MSASGLAAVVARPYDRYQALIDGRVTVDGDLLDVTVASRPIAGFGALMRKEFLVGEMSLSFYAILRSHGFDGLVGLPVFPLIMFRHADVLVRADSGLRTPQDLVGKTIALPEYAMTSGVWVRQLFAADYGVRPGQLSWVTTRAPVMLTEAQASPPADVSVTRRSGISQFDLLRSGEVDAAVGTLPRRQPAGAPRLRCLFDDPASLELAYYHQHGFIPVNHLLVMQRDRYEADPKLAKALYHAFDEAKEVALDALCDFGFPPISLPQAYHAVRSQLALFGDDPWPYGLSRNRTAVKALLDACRSQGLLRGDLGVDDLFVPELHET